MKKIKKITSMLMLLLTCLNPFINLFALTNKSQIVEDGGSKEVKSDGIKISKNIYPSDLENYFDIVLEVQTKQKAVDPDLAVVIVMDISNTMTESLGDSTRLKEARKASNEFIDLFANRSEENKNIDRKLGFVAFNTSAHEIIKLGNCDNSNKEQLKEDIGTRINAEMKGTDPNGSRYTERFTNIEAGLQMAKDMLDKSSASKKYIIFLSDGFPTTYIKDGYTGYNPYTEGGFYDSVKKASLPYGTSYSDQSAIKAREKATEVKASGIGIYSVGVGIGGQTIQKFIDQTNGKEWSVVDRTSKTYEIGSAQSADSYKNWLKNSIGSGYYYDVESTGGITNAFEDIFEQIMILSEATWVTEDPMNSNTQPKTIEFVGMYGEKDILSDEVIPSSKYPNKASFDLKTDKLNWDLKKSTPIKKGDTYIYTLKYRVRLKNELEEFTENKAYKTNGITTLNYTVKKNNKSRDGKLEFPIPQVKGHLGKIEFNKLSSYLNKPLSGVEFEIKHDPTCECMNERKHISDDFSMTSTSNSEGKVIFDKIPSGHKYILHEIKTDEYHDLDETKYKFEVSYGNTTPDFKDKEIINNHKTKNLTIEKVVEGVSYNKSFKFEINAKYKDENLNGKFIATINNKDEEVEFINGKLEISLKDKDNITIKNLPYGMKFTIKELDSEGFIVKYKINSSKVIYSNSTEEITLDDDVNILFTNISGYQLPATGSAGMLILLIIGSLLMVTPVIYIIKNALEEKADY